MSAERAGARADVWRNHLSRAQFLVARDPQSNEIITPWGTPQNIHSGVKTYDFEDNTQTEEKTVFESEPQEKAAR